MEFLKGSFTFVHGDNRRTIEEVNGPNSAIQRFTVHTRDPLGNHYHNRRVETFIWHQGRGVVYLIFLDVWKRETGREKIEVAAGSVLEIPRNTAHLFVMEPGTVFICHSSIPFNPHAKDMIPYEITPW